MVSQGNAPQAAMLGNNLEEEESQHSKMNMEEDAELEPKVFSAFGRIDLISIEIY